MSREWYLVAIVIGLLTAAGFFLFPGHTWLQQDTQIYVAILEHLRHPQHLARDLVATRPHVSWTAFDEITAVLCRTPGMDFRAALTLQQVLSRLAGMTGAFLIALSLGLRTSLALLVAAIFGLGASVTGPAVLTIEYEPVPRGFAFLIGLLALGLAAHKRWWAAGAAALVATLYHPPTLVPFWGIAILFWIWHGEKRERRGLVLCLLMAFAALLLLNRMQAGERESQQLFGRIDAALEQIQRMRAPYNWISMWPAYWIWHYLALTLFTVAAWWRLRDRMTEPLRWFSLGLPVWGVLSMPVSFLLLEEMKWSLLPQFQPMRALLYVATFAMILGAAAGVAAAARGRGWESLLWLAPVYAIPAHTRALGLFTVDLTQALARERLLLVAGLAMLAAIAAFARGMGKPHASTAWAAALLAPIVLIPNWGGMVNYPDLHTPEIADLSLWAKQNTPENAVFLFADAGKDLASGIFRAEAVRAIYVDWKGGGQANLLKDFADEWWSRWQKAHPLSYEPGGADAYRSLGVDYIVLLPKSSAPGMTQVYANAKYRVFALR
jgi:hypothetical protein